MAGLPKPTDRRFGIARRRLMAAAKRDHDALCTESSQITRLALPAWYSWEQHTFGLYESVIRCPVEFPPPREFEDHIRAEDICALPKEPVA